MSPVTTDERVRVLDALAQGRGSAGAIRDALSAMGRDLSLDRITLSLVALQGDGQVRRITGEGPKPDTWEALARDPALEDLLDGPRVLPGPDPLATAHVDCQSYATHGTAHRWDAQAGRFRCYLCAPEGAAPSPGGPNGAHV